MKANQIEIQNNYVARITRDNNDIYEELEAYRRKYRHITKILHEQKEENKILKNKISFLHTNYKNIIESVSKKVQNHG